MNLGKLDFEYYMKKALYEAKKAMELDEVPVGAVVISSEGEIISSAHNKCIMLNDPTAHAEIIAMWGAIAAARPFGRTNPM